MPADILKPETAFLWFPFLAAHKAGSGRNRKNKPEEREAPYQNLWRRFQRERRHKAYPVIGI
jgi:hypothetical protein